MKGNDERIEVEQSENRDQISFRANQMKRKKRTEKLVIIYERTDEEKTREHR